MKTYAGPELPSHAVAHITGDRTRMSSEPLPPGAAGAFIACIDGISLERTWGGYDNEARWPDNIAVLPGNHQLAVVYSLLRRKRAWWANVELDVEAGRRYVIKGEPRGASAHVWVLDENAVVVAMGVPRTGRVRPVDPCP